MKSVIPQKNLCSIPIPNWPYTQGVLVTKTTTYAISDEINLVFDTTSFHIMDVFRNTCSPHSFIGKIMACIQLYSIILIQLAVNSWVSS